MSLTINMGGGGGASIMVVGGSTQPASASEKTIWVNTSTTITSYVFSYAEPSTPVNGMVWIKTGSSSPVEFNALNGSNVLMVYPTQCKQYVSGAWASKTAESYINGNWVPWIVYFFKSGEGPTAGWTSYIHNVSGTDRGTWSITTEKMTFGGNSRQYMGLIVKRDQRVNLTGVSKIYFHVDKKINGCYLAGSVYETEPTSYDAGIPTKAVAASALGDQTLELDVSDLSGMHTVCASCSIDDYISGDAAYVYDIWMA